MIVFPIEDVIEDLHEPDEVEEGLKLCGFDLQAGNFLYPAEGKIEHLSAISDDRIGNGRVG